MAVKLRLKRMGAKARPFYRIVATDSRSPRDGRFIETVGTYNPIDDSKVTLDEEKVMKWLNNGAQPTDTVRNILSDNGVWAKFKAGKVKKAPAKKATKKAESAKKETTKKAATTTKKAPAKKTTTTKKTTAKKESK